MSILGRSHEAGWVSEWRVDEASDYEKKGL
jgi:hypothetical protein